MPTEGGFAAAAGFQPAGWVKKQSTFLHPRPLLHAGFGRGDDGPAAAAAGFQPAG